MTKSLLFTSFFVAIGSCAFAQGTATTLPTRPFENLKIENLPPPDQDCIVMSRQARETPSRLLHAHHALFHAMNRTVDVPVGGGYRVVTGLVPTPNIAAQAYDTDVDATVVARAFVNGDQYRYMLPARPSSNAIGMRAFRPSCPSSLP